MQYIKTFIVLVGATMSLHSAVAANEGASATATSTESASGPTPQVTDTPATEKATPLNSAVKPAQRDEVIPSVFKDMIVVQRKAKKKTGRFLFSPSGTIDFSDGPITSYGINTNVGYAFSEFFEAYLNFVPTFITVERPVVKKVRELGAGQYDISYRRPKMQYGLELYWLPAYGKESWGPYSIVRSDTFVKFGAAQIAFSGASGLRFNAMIGKTYFVNRIWNIRGAAGLGYGQSIVEDKKVFNFVPVLEIGLVYYL